MDPEPVSEILIDWHILVESFILFLTLFFSAMISGAEVAFFSLSKTDIERFSKLNGSEANLVLRLLKNPKKLLATILIANNFINILIVLLFATLGAFFFEGLHEKVRFTTEVILITFLILFFGEVLPKLYAARNFETFSLLMARPIFALNRVLSPISYLLTGLTGIVERRLNKKNIDFTVEKLSQALELTRDDATTKHEKNILKGVVDFANTETVRVMKPRIDVFAISDEESFLEVLEKIISKGFSRNPVYHENIDQIIGILYTKDLLPHITKKKFNWQTLIRAPYFVPENKKLKDLLAEFQEKKNHLAIVADEYGGTSGLITLEDVIEEIVGDINDEFDMDDLTYSKLDNSNYIFEGKTTLKDFYRILDIDEENFEKEKCESETLAGFVLEISGKFPQKNEKIVFENYIFTIKAINRKRIRKLKVTISDENKRK